MLNISTQQSELNQLVFRLQRFSGLSLDFVNSLQTKWTIEDFDQLSSSPVFSPYNITLCDAKFMGVYVRSFNDVTESHIDLLYISDTEHVDVISSMKGFFSVRHYFYSCHKGFATPKHLCAASACILCRQPGCQNRERSSSNFDDGRKKMVSCRTCGFVFNSDLCFDAHVNQRICSFYSKCPGCSLTISKQSVSTYQCSKKRCTICSQFFEFGKNSKHDCFVQKPKNGKLAKVCPLTWL